MLRERRRAYETVRDAFLAYETAAATLLELGKQCHSIMLEERAKLRLPIETGADALDHVGESIQHANRAFTSVARAHPHLRKIPAGIGLADVGTTPTEENVRVFLRGVPSVAA